VRAALIVLAFVAGACDGDLDPPWELDHDRVIAVRANPPGIVEGERSELDALVSAKGGSAMEQAPLAATVVSPTSLASTLTNEEGKWIVSMPSPALLAAARTELGLAADAPVPLQVGVGYVVNGVQLGALKRVWLGKRVANPVLAEMIIDGEALDGKSELVVPKLVDVRFSVAAIPEDDVNWLTNVGEMHDFDLPEAYLRVEEDEELFAGQLAVVKRDEDGGVVWRLWPIRVE